MENYRRMALFAQVVQHGSMSAAARALGMSTSAVSQQVRALEREAGVALLHRSTRQLSLTDVGSRYYAACARLLDAAGEAEAELSAARHAPSGELRLSAPLGMADHIWYRDDLAQVRDAFQAQCGSGHGDGQRADGGRRFPRALRRPQGLELRTQGAGHLCQGVLHAGEDGLYRGRLKQ